MISTLYLSLNNIRRVRAPNSLNYLVLVLGYFNKARIFFTTDSIGSSENHKGLKFIWTYLKYPVNVEYIQITALIYDTVTDTNDPSF